MINPGTLRLLGVAPEFLDKIGQECLTLDLQPSYEPLPISGELEYLLGIPQIPVDMPADLTPFYYALRQQKYKYKLYKIFNCRTALQVEKLLQRKRNIPLFTKILIGKNPLNLDIVMEHAYPYLEQTTIPKEIEQYL